MAESIANRMPLPCLKHSIALPEALPMAESVFSAGRYTHVISLLLPSTRGGCQCSKKGRQPIKTPFERDSLVRFLQIRTETSRKYRGWWPAAIVRC